MLQVRERVQEARLPRWLRHLRHARGDGVEGREAGQPVRRRRVQVHDLRAGDRAAVHGAHKVRERLRVRLGLVVEDDEVEGGVHGRRRAQMRVGLLERRDAGDEEAAEHVAQQGAGGC